MRVLLLFPPEWLPTEPYLSLPMLTAVLRSAGHEVIQKDINVLMYDMMLNAPYIRHIQKKITDARAYYQQKNTVQSFNEEYWRLLNNINEERFTHLIEDVEKARKILKSDKFYDIDRLEWALNCFNETMTVISLVYYPAQIRFPPMETEIGYRSYMSPEILNAVDDERVNIFRDVYRRIIEPVIEDELPELMGISVVQKKQLIPTFTFCRMIKEKYPHVHIALGGNIITRIRDVLGKNVSLFSLFDTAILYEGETALLELVNALESRKKDLSQVPNLMYRDTNGIHTNANVSAVDIAKLPPPDFDGLPLDTYFVPERILPYLATRGCYWGHCAFCDHSQGYVKKFRTKPVHQIAEEIKFLKTKYGNRHFHFTDESYPPALFRKLSREFIREKTDIAWTTHLRFEDTLTGDDVWNDAAASGCRCLYFGYESGNKRVLQLMNKATNLEVIKTVLQKSAQHGIWNHCMGFFGFPGETRSEAEDSIRFLEENKEHVHSVGFMTFVIGKYSPVALAPERYGVSVYKNPEWDLAMDYYFTVQKGMGIQEAADFLEEFERNHDPKWDIRTCVREYIFLYVDHFQTNNLPQLNRKQNKGHLPR